MKLSRMPTHVTISFELAQTIYDTLQYYGNVCTYQGERIGGILKGCPRAPTPKPDDLVFEALVVLKKFEAEVRPQTKPSEPE